MLDLEAARRGHRKLKQSSLSPDEASILIDSVFFRYGLDPTLWTDFSGWRHIMIGSAEGFAGIVEWQLEEHYLVVLAPILEIPEEEDQLLEFYRMLLELNYHGTLSAHFSIYEDTLYLGITRPIRGLDEEEVDEAIRTVMVLADSYDDRLKELIHLIPPSLPELPDIKMRPKDAQIIGLTLSACDPHGRKIFRFLMEKWEALEYLVEAGTTGIALCFPINDQPYALAALHPGFADRKQEIILSWGGLQRKAEFPQKVIQDFQSEVMEISEVKTTANTGHIEVLESFNEKKAIALIEAMDGFAQHVIQGKFELEDHMQVEATPELEIQTTPTTFQCIHKSLQVCDSRIQEIFVDLIQGWHDARGEVACDSPGRIFLRFETGEHEYGHYGVLSHRINLAVLTVPFQDPYARIELAWSLASGQFAYLDYAEKEVHRYERIISNLPGFDDQAIQKSIILDDSFRKEHTSELLEAFLTLKSAATN